MPFLAIATLGCDATRDTNAFVVQNQNADPEAVDITAWLKEHLEGSGGTCNIRAKKGFELCPWYLMTADEFKKAKEQVTQPYEGTLLPLSITPKTFSTRVNEVIAQAQKNLPEGVTIPDYGSNQWEFKGVAFIVGYGSYAFLDRYQLNSVQKSVQLALIKHLSADECNAIRAGHIDAELANQAKIYILLDHFFGNDIAARCERKTFKRKEPCPVFVE